MEQRPIVQARLSALLERVEAGEEIQSTKPGSDYAHANHQSGLRAGAGLARKPRQRFLPRRWFLSCAQNQFRRRQPAGLGYAEFHARLKEHFGDGFIIADDTVREDLDLVDALAG